MSGLDETREQIERRMAQTRAALDARYMDDDLQLHAATVQNIAHWKVEDGYMEEQRVNLWLTIDSADRDTSIHPSSGSFVLRLQSEITSLISAKLVQLKFPLTDPAIRVGNNVIRFGVDAVATKPPTSVVTATIPRGTYSGTNLAFELMLRMNSALLASGYFGVGTFYVDESDGLVYNTVGPTLQAGCIEVTYIASGQRFVFRVLDGTGAPDTTPTNYVRLYSTQAYSDSANGLEPDDIFDILGFSRDSMADLGISTQTISGRDYYFLDSDVSYANSYTEYVDSIDPRYLAGLHSIEASNIFGIQCLYLSIKELEKANDTPATRPGPDDKVFKGSYFTRVTLKDAASTSDTAMDSTSSSYPGEKNYRTGPDRFDTLTVNVYRPDGSIADFNGRDWSVMLCLTIKSSQPPLPTFTRGGHGNS